MLSIILVMMHIMTKTESLTIIVYKAYKSNLIKIIKYS